MFLCGFLDGAITILHGSMSHWLFQIANVLLLAWMEKAM